MTARIRTLLLFATLSTLLAACATATGAPASDAAAPTQPASPSVEPSEAPVETPAETPAEDPADEREVAGTITAAEMAFSGPGGTIAEALAAGDSGEFPTLVNGVLFRDTDGAIYIATSVSDEASPTFDGPMLLVLNQPNDGPSWDMANAELLGLQEANGIVFKQDAQILGFLEVK